MANFMGPMAPPQAAPQTPPSMDVKTSPSQRAQFKDFMRGMSMPQVLPNIGMGVPPEQPSFAPMPQISSPMMSVDIFSAPPMMMADGGVVGGLNDLQQMSGQMVEALNTVVYGGDPSGGGFGGGFGGGMGSSMPMRPTVGMVPPPISSNAPLGGNMNPNATFSPGLPMPLVKQLPFTGTGNNGFGSVTQEPRVSKNQQLDFYNATPGTGTVSTQEPVSGFQGLLSAGSVMPAQIESIFSPADDIFAISQIPAMYAPAAMGLRESVQGLAMGGPVGGGADAGQMAADAFSGKPDGQQDGPSGGGIGPSEKADALSDILNAAPAPMPAPNYNLPQQAIMDTLNIPGPVQDAVNMATKGISMPGPMGIGSVNISPDFGNLLGGDIGLGATYAVNFFNGGEVDGRERGIAEGSMGGAGPAADPDGVGAGADSGAGADKGIDVTAPGSTGEAQSEFQSQLQEAYDEADKTVQVQQAGFENLDQYNDFVEGIQKTSDFVDKITGVAPVLGGLKKASDFFGLDIFDDTEDSSNVGQSLVDSAISKGGTYNPETGIMSYPTDGGTVSMNSYGLSTYTGSGPDPFAQQIDETSIGGAESIIPVLAEEVGVDSGASGPSVPNQIGGMPLPYDGDQVSTMSIPIMPIGMPTPEMDPLLLGPPTTGLPPFGLKTDPMVPPTVSPSALVPSTRPAIGPLRGPATFDPNAVLTPEFFASLLNPVRRPDFSVFGGPAIRMQEGGEVLDAAAGRFLEALQAA